MNEERLDKFYTEVVYRVKPTDEVKAKEEKVVRKSAILHHVIKEVCSEFNGSQLDHILEIGGGSGSNLAILKKYIKTNHATSADIFIPEEPLEGIYYIKSLVEELSSRIKPESIDLILMIEVIEHLFDPDSAVETVNKLLKDGGMFILTTPNLSSLVNRFMLLLGYLPWNAEVSARHTFGRPKVESSRYKGHEVVGHLRLFTFSTLIEFLEYYGWKIQKAYSLPQEYPVPTRKHFTNVFDFLRYYVAYLFIVGIERASVKLRRTLGTNIIVVCKKG